MATISPIRIANMALSNIGARSRIENFAEESTEAKEVNLWYDFSRLATLEGFDWNFARMRLRLATHADPPPEGQWLYRYQYPVDCVKARFLENTVASDGDNIPFKVEASIDGTTKTILTDLDEATLVYTFDQEQTSMFSPFFVKTLSFHIAHQIAYSLTGKTAIQDSMLEKWLMLMLTASSHEANEGVDKPPREAEHIRARA